MHKAYSLNFTMSKDDFYNIGKKLYSDMKQKIDRNLQHFYKDGVLDGSKLSKEWFPEIKADIFISHSHKDIDTAIELAGCLYETQKIVCFIDSCVWGYADKLLEAIDEKYSKNDEDDRFFIYELRNRSTAHVHMMLTVALAKMMYNCECLFFLNTPNSILPKDSVKEKTLSPWIYTERSMIQLIEKRSANEHRGIQENFSRSLDSLKVAYDVPDLPELKFETMVKWLNQNFGNKYKALDYLYRYGENRKGVIYG